VLHALFKHHKAVNAAFVEILGEKGPVISPAQVEFMEQVIPSLKVGWPIPLHCFYATCVSATSARGIRDRARECCTPHGIVPNQAFFEVCSAMGVESRPTVSQLPAFLGHLLAATAPTHGDAPKVKQFKRLLTDSLNVVPCPLPLPSLCPVLPVCHSP
jgi:hypothetical protein